MEILSTASSIGGLIAFIVALIIIPWCLSGDEGRENEFAAMAWFVIIAFIVLIYPIGTISHLPPIAWLALIPLYFAIGTLWFLWKWRGLILRKRQEADDAEKKMATGSYPGMTREKVRDGFRPEASRYKERIAGWIVLWPWSMLWTVARWPWRLAVKMAEWARGLADRMVDRLWNAA
jgi:hypothetical protein